MNDKIKELAHQAGFDNTIPIFDSNSKVWQYRNFDKEKFAELIIQECCREMGKYNVVTFAIDGVKEHFGIEQ